MNRIVHIIGKDGIDLTLAFDAGFAGKAGGDDFHLEMRLATFTPSGMAVMFIGLIDDPQFFRLEGLAQFALQSIGNLTHGSLSVRQIQSCHSPAEMTQAVYREDGYAAASALTSAAHPRQSRRHRIEGH
jgi:hypothetical protein